MALQGYLASVVQGLRDEDGLLCASLLDCFANFPLELMYEVRQKKVRPCA